jgi:hypothetical protein
MVASLGPSRALHPDRRKNGEGSGRGGALCDRSSKVPRFLHGAPGRNRTKGTKTVERLPAGRGDVSPRGLSAIASMAETIAGVARSQYAAGSRPPVVTGRTFSGWRLMPGRPFPRLRVDARLRASAVRPGPYEIPGLHPALALDQDRSSSPADELVLQPARTWFALSGSRRACRGTPFDSPCSRRRPRGRRGSVSCDHASYDRPGVDADPQLETRRRRARRTRRESLAATDVRSRQSPGDPRLERPRAGVHESFLP